MWYIYIMEFYSAIKKNEFMKFLGKWMDLEFPCTETYKVCKTNGSLFQLMAN